MKWNSINSNIEIPWHKVLVYDGGNTFFGYLKRITITQGCKKIEWTLVPELEEQLPILYWAEIQKAQR